MKVVVTGGAGFIGATLARALIRQGEDVVVVDNLSAGAASLVPTEARFINADVRDPDALRNAFAGGETIFHQAAVGSIPRSLANPVAVHENNATGTLNVLVAAEYAGCSRVVYASSSSVYGESDHPVKHEDDPTRPISPYGVSKLAGELYCRVWGRLRRVETVCLRYFNVFGPNQRQEGPYSAVFPSFISSLAEGRQPVVYGDGDQTRDFTFVDDVVRANIAAAQLNVTEGNEAIFNIGAGDPRSVNEVLNSVAKAMSVDIDPLIMPARAGDVRHSSADISRAMTSLGWTPFVPWEEAVRRTCLT